MWKKESYSEPLQSETRAAAKENCGRKSLLIEHEVCHLKLESSQTPETAAGRHLSGPYIKVLPGPGCVSPSHRGPFALAGGPFRLRARPHRGTSRRVRCAINAPALRSGVWAHVTAASPGRAVELGRRTGEIGGDRWRGHTTLTHKSTVRLDLAAQSWAFLFGILMCIATQKYHNICPKYIYTCM